MKMLFDNRLEYATISATNESLNYPSSNLVHPFLYTRFQSSGTSSTVTASWDEDQCISCFFFGYYTLTSIEIRFYDSSATLLQTLNPTPSEYVQSIYFTKLENVRSIQIDISGSSPLYLGGIGVGCCYEWPDPLASYERGNDDSSEFSESPYGQTSSNYIEPLRALTFSFREIEEDVKEEIDTNYKSVGVGKSLYFDAFPGNHSKEPALYCKITRPITFDYEPRRYSTRLQVKESR